MSYIDLSQINSVCFTRNYIKTILDSLARNYLQTYNNWQKLTDAGAFCNLLVACVTSLFDVFNNVVNFAKSAKNKVNRRIVNTTATGQLAIEEEN